MKKLFQILVALSLLVSQLLSTVPVNAATAISINSPSSGSTLNADSFTVTGTATADRKITVKVNGTTVGTTTSDGSGNWSLNVTGQSGSVKTIEAVASGQYGYVNNQGDATIKTFNTVNDTYVGSTVNTIDLQQQISVRPQGDQMVSIGGFGNNNTIKVWGLANPESPTITHSLTAAEDYTNWAEYSADGTYFYVASTESDFSVSRIKRYNSADPTISVDVGGYDQAAPFAIVRSTDGTELYVSNVVGDGVNASVSKINIASNSQTSTFSYGVAGTAARLVNGPNNQGYGANFSGNSVLPFNFTTNNASSAISVTGNPVIGAFNSDGTKFNVATLTGNEIVTIDTTLNSVVSTIPLTNPAYIIRGTLYDKFYVTQPSLSQISVLNGTDLSTLGTISGGDQPAVLALAPVESVSASVSLTLSGGSSGLADTGDNTRLLTAFALFLLTSGIIGSLTYSQFYKFHSYSVE